MNDETTRDWIATVGLGRRGPEAAPDRSAGREGGWKAVLDGVRLRFRRWRLRADELEPGRWWNGSLRSVDQLATAARRAKAARLPLVAERDRNWDALESLELLLAETDASARIADIGLEDHQPLLEWLRIVDHGWVQPEEGTRVRANRLLAMAGGPHDQAGAELPGTPGHYHVVVCRSLPGDRIPLRERLDQARRLLRPGGIFVLSTEFWDMPDPYDGGERRCARDHLCCRSSVDDLSREALDMGMVPLAPLFVGETPEGCHPDLLGVGVSPTKLAFRKKESGSGA